MMNPMLEDPHATSPPTTRLPPTAVPAIRAVRVEVVRGPDAGLVTESARERIVIGTHRTADVVLSDRTVSRFHIELVNAGDRLVLRDLGSRNGTLLDGVEIERARLHGPTIVAVGETELRIDLHGDAVPLALAPQEQFGMLIGTSPAMRLLFARLEHAALLDAHVLIEGERGSGKDAAAAALHERSSRRDRALDVIDGAGAALIVEQQLFGRHGALERCHGGTLVIDDIGALARGTQRALVRALEDRIVRRPDGSTVDTDVRVIALSRRNLRIDVNADRFAPDLFELIAGAHVRIPPLRERPEDIPLLLRHFLGELEATGTHAAVHLLAAESIELLRAATWPGNVRELRAYVEQAVAADRAGADPPSLEPPLLDGSLPLREARRRWTEHFERAYVVELLARTGGNVSAAALLAGVDRVYMHRIITRWGLRAELERARD